MALWPGCIYALGIFVSQCIDCPFCPWDSNRGVNRQHPKNQHTLHAVVLTQALLQLWHHWQDKVDVMTVKAACGTSGLGHDLQSSETL